MTSVYVNGGVGEGDVFSEAGEVEQRRRSVRTMGGIRLFEDNFNFDIEVSKSLSLEHIEDDDVVVVE